MINDEILNQNSGDYCKNYQAAGNLTIEGMSYSETKDLFITLLQQNFPKLKEDAMLIAEQRIKKWEKAFFEKADKILSLNDFEKFKSPDVQYISNKAVNIIARRQEEELNDLLSNLIIERIKSDKEESFDTIALNQAIENLDKITINQIKFLSLKYITDQYVFKDSNNKELTFQRINDYILPLLDYDNDLCLSYIQGLGLTFDAFEKTYIGNFSEKTFREFLEINKDNLNVDVRQYIAKFLLVSDLSSKKRMLISPVCEIIVKNYLMNKFDGDILK